MMTHQEVFNEIWAHFSRKGARLSKDTNGTCAYRLNGKADGALRCAVGVLIPDELYDPCMDEIVQLMPVLNVIGLTEHFKPLLSLQGIHDTSGSIADLRPRLRRYAEINGLVIPVTS